MQQISRRKFVSFCVYNVMTNLAHQVPSIPHAPKNWAGLVDLVMKSDTVWDMVTCWNEISSKASHDNIVQEFPLKSAIYIYVYTQAY